ncbi:hypothetical protein CR513_20803, partial [Mucuna pruriens]
LLINLLTNKRSPSQDASSLEWPPSLPDFEEKRRKGDCKKKCLRGWASLGEKETLPKSQSSTLYGLLLHFFFYIGCLEFCVKKVDPKDPMEQLMHLKQAGCLDQYEELFDGLICKVNLSERQKTTNEMTRTRSRTETPNWDRSRTDSDSD